MDYIWFWTFWHWSKESFRSRAVLRSPLHGIASHWDEWFRHEATEIEHRSIERIGRTVAAQRQFVFWLCRHWTPEVNPERNRLVPRFILGQLAQVPPFNLWPAFARYRTSYGLKGIRAVVLAEKSAGEAKDIRQIEAVILPPDDATSSAIVAEGFQAEAADLEPTLQAAKGLLGGKGLAIFLARWLLTGRRPYPRWVATALSLGWIAVFGLILMLLFGPEPGGDLFMAEAALVALWLGLIFIAVGAAGALAWSAWRVGSALRTRLGHNQVRLRMNGGLTLRGGSAGLPFCLNILSSLGRAYPQDAGPSWLWRRLFHKLNSTGDSWAATGALTADGRIKSVVLEPKLRACLKTGQIKGILTPRQSEASEQAVDGVSKALSPSTIHEPQPEIATGIRLGFAAENAPLQVQRCAHLARAMNVLGGFFDRRQSAMNVFALSISAIMLAALPDLRSVLLPYPAPMAVLPSSPSPYYLWVSLDTKHPKYFSVVLESKYWSNRRADVKPSGGITPSIRAEMHFHRLTGMTTANEDDGVVWIERKQRFLTREFFPGDRIGRYSIPYLSHLGHE